MVQIIILLALGAVGAGALIAADLFLLILAIVVYVVSHVYPWAARIAIWAAKLENILAFAVLALILIDVSILGIIILPGMLKIAAILPLLPALMFLIPVQIGLVVWGIRLIIWTYRGWRGIVSGIYATIQMQIIKAKIKVDVTKETDWRGRFSEVKTKLSAEAEQARKKISRRKGDMKLKDRLLMAAMGNKVVLKVFSVPIVMKILTKETQAIVWVISPFKKKQEEKPS